MSSTRSSASHDRSGFTLVETIVTIGLIAALAAFILPNVVQKAGAGDPVKAQNDLNTLRTALESFATDGKAGFPHQLSTLTTKPIAGVSRLIDSTIMTANETALWRGPYMSAMVPLGIGDSVATGYSAYAMNFVDRYDVVANVPEHTTTGTLSGGFLATSTLFAAIQLHGLSLAQAETLNALIDGTTDSNQVDGSNTTGRLRFGVANAGVVVAYYLASPITP
jgi:prepilin-type N-terminal cleavage/methylation domain-containing protein